MTQPPAPLDGALLDSVAALVRDASSVLFITGAGISADSGLPTYRGIGGLYHDAETQDGIPIEEALSGPMFRKNPALTWKYIHQIEHACRGARENRAHQVIADFERRMRRTWVLTQNVDGLHRRAGSKNVIEIHGDVHDLSCTICRWEKRVDDFAGLAPLPRCPSCNGVIRPRVVLFGEMLPERGITALERELGQGFDLIFSIGTTSAFPYIAGPVVMARRMGLPVVEVNPGESEVSSIVSHRIRAGAAVAMDAIAKRLGW